MQILEDIIRIGKKEWEMIHDALEVDFRVVDENNDPLPAEDIDSGLNGIDAKRCSELINKWNFKCGSEPWSCVFEFDNGLKIHLRLCIEEFGGVFEWFFENDFDSESEYELEERTEWDQYNRNTGEIDIKYVCLFEIV